jgi:hypothetical protein
MVTQTMLLMFVPLSMMTVTFIDCCGLVRDPHATPHCGLVGDPHATTCCGLVGDPHACHHCGLVDDPHVISSCRGLVSDPHVLNSIHGLVNDPQDSLALLQLIWKLHRINSTWLIINPTYFFPKIGLTCGFHSKFHFFILIPTHVATII